MAECIYYSAQCIDVGMECNARNEKKRASDDDAVCQTDPENENLKDCYKNNPACQKKDKYCMHLTF